MLTTPLEYVETLSGPGCEWLAEFLQYMGSRHPDITPVMFRQRPMFKIGKSYVMFTVAKEHFTLHTLNFDLVEGLKAILPKAEFGKGSVKVKFSDTIAKPVLKGFCDEIIRLNLLPDAHAVSVAPALPYEEKLVNAFSVGKAKWLPLYEALRDRAKARLPEFTEYFPAANVLWKHNSAFAQISAVASLMRIEFFSDSIHPERNPVKTLQTSKNRFAHTVETVDDACFGQLLDWIEESYFLTKK